MTRPHQEHLTAPRLCHATARERALGEASRTRYDLAIIGGGVTGVAIARLAASAGLSVVLCEADDFASGTSSRSTKLIHGGIRYLQNFEFGLVGETARERKEVRHLAPHLARPRWMVLPAKNRLQLGIFTGAVSIYEKMGQVDAADRHQIWHESELSEYEPLLRRDSLPHAVAYREYVTDDARLVLALARDASDRGATLLAQSKVVGFEVHNDKIQAMRVRPTGEKSEITIRAKVVVNAAGPWVDELLALESAQAKPKIRLSSGIHLVVSASELPVQNLLMLEARDKRRFFALRRDQVVHVGTTDQPHRFGAEHWPAIAQSDVDYLLDALPLSLDRPRLTRGLIRSAWSGLRPLIAKSGDNTAQLSRSDEISLGPNGMITIAGGKLTGFPGMARKCLTWIGKALGTSLQAKDAQAQLPGAAALVGHDDRCEAMANELMNLFPDIVLPTAQRMIEFYGTDAATIARLGSKPLHLADFCSGEVQWAIEVEGASSLEDIVYRRMRVPYYATPSANDWPLVCEAIADKAAMHFDWNEQKRATELRRLMARFDEDMKPVPI
jgi:glycerol-3-phosphate dehydrogenase